MEQPKIAERVSARAALAGNPSDGYGGAVFAVPVPAYRAVVEIEPSHDGYELFDELSGRARFQTWADVEQATLAASPERPHGLLLGTLAEVAGRNGTIPPFRLTAHTSIPVSVGLAGSSAIVIAALRALLAAVDDSMGVDELAVRALAIETEHLGITAGLQDRVVQANDRPMLMEFGAVHTAHGPGQFTPVHAGRSFSLFVASRAATAEASQVVHGDLRTRFVHGDTAVRDAMPHVARHALDAANAFASGDATGLGAAMDATFDLRTSMLDLDPAHVEMVDAARSVGAHANYTGSGGSVIVLAPTHDVAQRARQLLAELGCSIVPTSHSIG